MKRLLRPWTLLALLVPATLLTACDDKMSAGDAVYFPILDHKFTAVRQFQCYDPMSPITYVEELVCQGDGKTFHLNLLQLNGKERGDISGPGELEVFDRLQANMNAGGRNRILHQRDFRIEDLTLADRNYRVFQDGLLVNSMGGGSRASEASISYWVIPFVQDRPFYRVTISVETGRVGFPLGYEEYVNTATGAALVSEMRVLSLDYGNAAAPGPMHAPVIKSRKRVSLDDVIAQATGPVFFPMALPVGYQLDYIEDIVMSSDANQSGQPRDVGMTRFLFTDGVDVLEILQHPPTYGGSLDRVLGPDGAQFGGAGQPNDRLVVPVYRFSSISIATAITTDYQITIESKLASERFDRVLESLQRLN